ncbi:MAG: glycoside hydrolase family 2 TIM barrel-domain containing protein [Planctomycetota bacterium]
MIPAVIVLLVALRGCAGGVLEPPPQEQATPCRHLVARSDCGAPGEQPFLISGSDYRYPEEHVPASVVASDDAARTVAFGEQVLFRFEGLHPEAAYELRLTYLSDGERVQSLSANGTLLQEKVTLPAGEIVTAAIPLPRECTVAGSLTLLFQRLSGPNAVVSVIEVWSSNPALLYLLELDVRAGLREGIEGEVVDRAGVIDTSGAQVELSIDGTSLSQEAVVGTAGKFTAPLPKEWLTARGGTMRLRVFKGPLLAERTKALSDVLATRLPRLTPCPAAVAGIKAIGGEGVSLRLDGTWLFHPAPADQFWTLEHSTASGWSEIEVPGEWVEQGFTVAKDEAAAYRRCFNVPAEWAAHRIKLRFDAVYSDATVWINGVEAGSHEGGFTPFELDITHLVKPGRENSISLAVKSDSLADVLASASAYAAHPLGGILRKVTLFPVPVVNVAALQLSTVFDPDGDACLELRLDVANESDRLRQDLELEVILQGPRGDPVPLEGSRVELPPVPAGQTVRLERRLLVKQPARWDCEHPNLHTLTLELVENGRELETVRRRFGFREVAVRGNQLLVNGTPVKLRGVNRHEAHPLRGRSLTPELWRKDAQLFIEANCNYVRTSHYPPAEEFIEACDELGLFVEEEAPLCWVGHPANVAWETWDAANAGYFARMVRANLEMIERDRNHPSVLIWSLANESRWTENFRSVRTYVDAADPSRPKSFHDQAWGGFNNAGSDLPIANMHYPGPAGPEQAAASERPVLFGEYCHLNTYNRAELVTDPGVRDAWGLGFARMWEKMLAEPAVLGGAIWAGIDDIFYLPDGRVAGYGSWGPVDGWRREKPEYWHVKKTYSPVRVLTKCLAVPAAGEPLELKVANRHDFTNLSDVRIEWSIAGESEVVHADLPPHAEGIIRIRPRAADLDGKELSLRFVSPRGFVIDEERIPIGAETSRDALPPRAAAGPGPRLVSDGPIWELTADPFVWRADRNTGTFESVRVGAHNLLVGGPTLMLLPLKGGPCRPDYRADIVPFNDTCCEWALESFQYRDGDLLIMGSHREASLNLTLHFDSVEQVGILTVQYQLTCREKIGPRQIGLVFDLPRSFDTLAWSREAQWSTYPDDHIGRPTGTAKAFYDGAPPDCDRRVAPTCPWAHDSHPLGSNDFRATRTNIHWASLQDSEGYAVIVRSNGKHAVRAWVEGDRVRLLVASFTTGGAEPFFSSHLAGERLPLEPGSTFEHTFRLELVGPEER